MALINSQPNYNTTSISLSNVVNLLVNNLSASALQMRSLTLKPSNLIQGSYSTKGDYRQIDVTIPDNLILVSSSTFEIATTGASSAGGSSTWEFYVIVNGVSYYLGTGNPKWPGNGNMYIPAVNFKNTIGKYLTKDDTLSFKIICTVTGTYGLNSNFNSNPTFGSLII